MTAVTMVAAVFPWDIGDVNFKQVFFGKEPKIHSSLHILKNTRVANINSISYLYSPNSLNQNKVSL